MKCAFAIPGNVDLPTGGYGYDRRVMAALPEHGVTIQHLPLPGSFPSPTEDDLRVTRRILTAIDHDTLLLIDGLAFGALPESLVRDIKAPIVALVHHPLAMESGLSDERASDLKMMERKALRHARRVIATSAATARTLTERYDVPASRIAVAEPGVDPAPRSLGSGREVPALLCVGAVSRRKGYHVLVQGLAMITDAPWTLTIAGALDRNPEMARELHETIASHGLTGRVSLVGELSNVTLAEAYASADIFVMPSLYEGYGMVITEALARGLPIVSTTGGALADVVPAEAALLVPPDDAAALANALKTMILDSGLRGSKAAAAWNLAVDLPRWPQTTAVIACALKDALA